MHPKASLRDRRTTTPVITGVVVRLSRRLPKAGSLKENQEHFRTQSPQALWPGLGLPGEALVNGNFIIKTLVLWPLQL